jgi:CoA:oxalate CoA-transferase
MVLHNLGAEVIKVEAPRVGDDARAFGPFLDGLDGDTKSAYFTSLNAGKQSLSLDLKKPQGKEILGRLVQKVDVLIENYRPGTLARLGFSESRIRELNPDIIYATISGFGHTGPDSTKPAYDLIIQALSGLLSITGTEDGQLTKVGSSIADIVSGMYTALGIVAALYRRDKLDVGARVDVAMLDSTVSVLENAIARYQVTQTSPKPLGLRHPSITPFENFQTRDVPIIVAAGNDRLFAALCHTIERPELLRDERFKTNSLRTENYAALRSIINAALAKDTAASWLQRLEEQGVPCARINTMADLFESAQLEERNMLVLVEGEKEFKVVGNPIKFRHEPDERQKAGAPDLGQHNEKVLRDLLALSRDEIAALYAAQVLSNND